MPEGSESDAVAADAAAASDGQAPSPAGVVVPVANPDEPTGELGIAVSLDQFSGPMDLLLYLVRRLEVDVRDLPITAIADQFSAWVASAEDLDLEQAGDFVVMAATLLEIKARMVAPPPAGTEVADDGEDDYDPRAGLIRRLLVYRAAKEAAFDLDRRDSERRLRHERGHREVVPDDPGEVDAWELKDVDVGALATLWYDLLKRIDGLGPRTVIVDDMPMGVRMAQLAESLRTRGECRLSEFFALEPGKIGRVGLVMAVLESTRQRFLQIRQGEQYGDVLMRFRPEDERAMATGDPGPPEQLPKRQRRPPLVTWSPADGSAAEIGEAETGDEPPPPENEEQRFLRELEQGIGVERLLSRAADLEVGFIAWWEETHPGEPLPPGVVKAPPPPPPEPPRPEPVAAPVPAVEAPAKPKRQPPRPRPVGEVAPAATDPAAVAAASAPADIIPDPSPEPFAAVPAPSPVCMPAIPDPRPAAVQAPDPVAGEPALPSDPVAGGVEAVPAPPAGVVAIPEPDPPLPVAAAAPADLRDPEPTFIVEPLAAVPPEVEEPAGVPAPPTAAAPVVGAEAQPEPEIASEPSAEAVQPEPPTNGPAPVSSATAVESEAPAEAVTDAEPLPAAATDGLSEPEEPIAAVPVAEPMVEPARAEIPAASVLPPADEPVPEPVAAPEPEPAPEPEAVREPEPITVPEPVAVPEPEPAPEPEAVREPEPIPVPEPVAASEPIPEPEAVREATPVAVPMPEAAAAPESDVVAEPEAVRDPEPVSAPVLVAAAPPGPPPDPDPPPGPPPTSSTSQTAPPTTTPILPSTASRPMSRPNHTMIAALIALNVLVVVGFFVWFYRPADVLALADGPDGAVVSRDGEVSWTLNLPLEDRAKAPLPQVAPAGLGTCVWRDARTVVFTPTGSLPADATISINFPPELRAAGSFRFPKDAAPVRSLRTLPALSATAASSQAPAFGEASIVLALNRQPADPTALFEAISIVPKVSFQAVCDDDGLRLTGDFVPGSTYRIALAATGSRRADDQPAAWSADVAVPQRAPGVRLQAGVRPQAVLEAVGIDLLVVEAGARREVLRPQPGADGIARVVVPAWLLSGEVDRLAVRWDGGSTSVAVNRQQLHYDPADLVPLLTGGSLPVVSVR